MPRLRAILSIHDVMPSTLGRVAGLVDWLSAMGMPAPVLLVCPGFQWKAEEIAQLREWAAAGSELAGHGWRHRAVRRRSLYHRAHGALLSRDAAEHLSRPRAELIQMVQACHGWFQKQQLPAPRFYVPPAWAVGALTRTDLAALPFARYETLAGIYDAERGRLAGLPLAGFEADTASRAAFLRRFNAFNEAASRRTGRALRIGLHPFDREYLLAEEIAGLLTRVDEFTTHWDV